MRRCIIRYTHFILISAALISAKAFPSDCDALMTGRLTNVVSNCFFLGLMGTEAKTYYGQSETEYVPVFVFHGRNFYFEGDEAGVYFAGNVAADNFWYASIFLGYEEKPYDIADHKNLGLTKRRRATFNLGSRITAGGRWGQLDARFSSDISGAHDGNGANLEYTYRFSGRDFVFAPYAGYRLSDRKKASYLFSVASAGGQATESDFSGDSTTELYVGARSFLKLETHWYAYVDILANQLDDGAHASPLVEQNSSQSVSIGVVYLF